MWSPLPVMLPACFLYSCHSPFEIHIFSHLCGFEWKEMKGKCWTVSNTRSHLATSLALCPESKVWAAVFKLLLKTVTGHFLSWMQFSPNFFYALLRWDILLPFPFIGKLIFCLFLHFFPSSRTAFRTICIWLTLPTSGHCVCLQTHHRATPE